MSKNVKMTNPMKVITGPNTGDNFHGICHFYIFTHCHIPP